MTDFKTSFEELRTVITQTIKKIDGFSIPEINTEGAFYESHSEIMDFLTETSETLYQSMYKTTNLVEDNIRSVYVLSDDATLEGHASELETQLAQLRITGEAIASLPTDFNDSFAEVIVKYTDMNHTLLDSFSKIREMHKTSGLGGSESTDQAVNLVHQRGAKEMILYTGANRIIKDIMRSYRETCIKLMSILVVILGRWESKVEDKIDLESFSESMIMSNYEGIEKLSTKNKRGKRSSDIYM
jgi:predicted Zn-dependent protease with MMP-like domain